MPVRVLIVDDSAVMRKVLTEIINSVPDLQVVGAAADAHAARELIKTVLPDVVTLDVAMPGMDGLDFLDRLMRLRPTPVVMVSAFTESGSDATLRALELGAVDFIGKPRLETGQSIEAYTLELAEKLRAARGARLKRPGGLAGAPSPLAPKAAPSPVAAAPVRWAGGKILFVGASTGGTEALKVFLLGLPADCPPVLIVQHMPETFTASFAKRLDSLCAPRVIESQGNERVEGGTVYIAPGHSHLQIRRGPTGFLTELLQTPPVNRHRPSVDVLFHSAANVVGRNAVGVILTGMGKDGAQGMLAMHQAGAKTYGQDEASCVVYGMPREAALIGAVDEVVSLNDMARRVLAGLGRS